MAGDLAGLVDELGLERFHLLGVSMGGMIAQEYAIAHAGRLLSASFCCTYSYPGPFCLRMFACWRDLVPRLGVGFTQREVLLWAFTTDFFEQRRPSSRRSRRSWPRTRRRPTATSPSLPRSRRTTPAGGSRR